MLPSLVIDEVRNGLLRTLLTQFEPSNDAFKQAVHRLVDSPAWMKGPYLQLGLPFQPGGRGRNFFEGFQTKFHGHRHQELAWTRIGKQGRSTLVATGTGSGKTECFLYPVLDHAAKARKSGQKGIKSIIVYPMNALADDQARRFAEIVHETPAFKGIRVGLFVGTGKSSFKKVKSGEDPPKEPAEMGPKYVITDKDRLRSDPPDILLTNYKMLDFLMIRPKDQPLWQHNTPDTLRHLIVDELHTFDGAQGTDLAMLIRRLRHRLEVSDKHLVCIGTSATLGDASDSQPLRDYAGQVFGTSFDDDSVITETRQAFEAFLNGALVENYLADERTVRTAVTTDHFSSQEEAIRTWIPAFFSDPDLQVQLLSGANSVEGRILLGQELKKHVLFQNLVRAIAGAPLTVDEIVDKLRRALPVALLPIGRDVIRALVGLISWARAWYPKQTSATHITQVGSLLSVRLQLWIRELNRLVATVTDDPSAMVLFPEGALDAPKTEIALPVIQCSKCRTTGWLTRRHKAKGRVELELESIYQAYFSRRKAPDLHRLYPVEPGGVAPDVSEVPLILNKLCRSCGELQPAQRTACLGCNSESLTDLLVAASTRTLKSGDQEVVVHDDTCPVCASRDSMVLLGARATTLAATAVERLFSTPVNDDKKLIVFSDSVQDAAHRAGFIEAKTDAHLTRGILAHVFRELQTPVPWLDAIVGIANTLSAGGTLAMSPEALVANFIAPEMQNRRDWFYLKEHGELPVGSLLPDLVLRRLQWRALEELTHLSDRGPTLSRTGIAVLFPALDAVDDVARDLLPMLRERIGGFDLADVRAVSDWTLGFILRLIRAGGIFHEGLESFAQTGNYKAFEFTKGRADWIPHRGKAPIPRFVNHGRGPRDFFTTEEGDANPLTSWFKTSLGTDLLRARGVSTEAYLMMMQALHRVGIGKFVAASMGDRSGMVFGLEPAALSLQTDLVRLQTASNSAFTWIPRAYQERLINLPSWENNGQLLSVIGNGTDWWKIRYGLGEARRVIAHEHTGLLERDERVGVQNRFMAKDPQPWFENLLSATPTLEMGVDIGDLSSVMLCGVPGNQASYLQRVGRAGRRDGNAAVFTIAESRQGGHDLYYFDKPIEMLAGPVDPPAIFLGAAEVLRRQLYAFFFDHWVKEENPKLPDKLGEVLDNIEGHAGELTRFPYNYLDFVNRKQPQVFRSFCEMLGEHLSRETRAKLDSYLEASEQSMEFKVRFLHFFEEGVVLRKSLKQRADRIRKQIQTLEGKPQDEQRDFEIAALKGEREGVTEQHAQLNKEYLLEAITNAGLLPNYAFPAEGVSLHTIIRKERLVDGQTEVKPVEVHRYSRPAAAALSEFAPRNTFYAHKSRVKINQIEFSGERSSGPVSHRLCANCHYLMPVTGLEEGHDCPKCGDSRWGAVNQVRPLLRLTKAVANVGSQYETRIREDDDKRQPEFYNRVLLMNHRPENVKFSWTFTAPDSVYGFEFLRSADFHDLNTGQGASDNTATPITIAGNDQAKPGFSLCGTCGVVQPYYNPAQHEEPREQEHLPDCRHRHVTSTEHLIDELFLYRNFESECIRILVPQGMGTDEQTVQSFMAAAQLGMRKRFGGKVDHLCFDTTQRSDSAGAAPKFYVLIYDSVPGGTGYLEKLLADEADSLAEVLKLALATMNTCACAQNPDLDGCYRCILQQTRDRTTVSRLRAIEILDQLVNGTFEKKSGVLLDDIYIDPELGSELERSFLMALKGIGGKQNLNTNTRLPAVGLVQEVYLGQVSYLLTVGEYRYWMQKQYAIDLPGSNKTLCKPDFLITPAKTGQAMKPIAVFIDGWNPHRDLLDDDGTKRSSLVASGLYHVWSVAHGDIERAKKGEASTDLDGLGSVLSSGQLPVVASDRIPTERPGTYQRNAVAELVSLLGATGSEDPLSLLNPTAIGLALRSAVKPDQLTSEQTALSGLLLASVPEWLHVQGKGLPIASAKPKGIELVGMAGKAIFGGADASGPAACAALVYEGPTDADDEEAFRTSWRHWLRTYNVMQTLGTVVLATRGQLEARSLMDVPKPKPTMPGAISHGWNLVLDEVLERLKPIFLALAQANRDLPTELGHEVEDGHGYRVAEAYWATRRLVFLTRSQQEHESTWQSVGMTVVLESDSSLGALHQFLA